MQNFKLAALADAYFTPLFLLGEEALQKLGAVKMTVDEYPGFPCRVSLEDAQIGEEVILLPYQHHRTNSPYQASGPIYARRGVETKQLDLNEIPKMLLHRLLSLRAYDENGMMVNASVVEGSVLKEALHKCLENLKVEYIHIHNAKQGCYNCLVVRD